MRLLWGSMLGFFLTATPEAQGPADAKWIWGSWAEEFDRPSGESCDFRRSIVLDGDVRAATLTITADNAYDCSINGDVVGKGRDWNVALRYDVAELLHSGENVVEVTAKNDGGPAAMIAILDVELFDGSRAWLVTDSDWLTRAEDGDEWRPARVFGAYGDGPWGELRFEEPRERSFEVPPGFRVEEAWRGLGSYLSLTLDGDGRPLLGAQDDGIVRLVDEDGDGAFDAEEPFTDELTHCQGLLWSEGLLFAVGRGPDGPGLYRVDGDDPGEPVLLGKFDGGTGEHGPHAVVAGPDGALYVAVGNHSSVASEWSEASPYHLYYEGHLLPSFQDPRGHATDVGAPGGVVVRVDREGREWRVLAGGFRNHYDLAFNAYGDLFTFDSDMEWDLGLPWYREVRLVHVVPGGEYGWRTGTTKWPASYADSLPPACEVGRGSPTGVEHYDGAMFPARYRGAILCGDWSRGRIVAFHLRPQGLSYTAEAEELVLGRPLNVTDLEVAPDGSLLFSTGGRGTEGWLYRLVYEGETGVAATPGPRAWPSYGDDTPRSLVLEHLSDPDRFARYAAARALERTNLRAVNLPGGLDPLALAEGLVVAARLGLEREDPEDCLRGIHRAAGLLVEEGLARRVALRALQLFLLDPDAPAELDPALARMILQRYPTGDRETDRELALIVAHLAPDGAVEALLKGLRTEGSRAEQVHLAYCLRAIPRGWTDATREEFAGWLAAASRWSGGMSFGGYVDRIAEDARAVFGAEHAHLLDFESGVPVPAAWTPPPAYGGTPWGYDATLAFLGRALDEERRSLQEGARVFDAGCARCHPMDGTGGELGPDLSTAVNRFSRADMLDTIVHPSRQVPEAYRAVEAFLVGGGVESGLPVVDDGAKLVLARTDGTRVTLTPTEIEERRPAELSLMPNALLDGLTLEEVADLFFFLESDARPHPPETSEWTTLFDGETLDGWIFDASIWRVDDGLIAGDGEGLPGSSFLISEGTYADFVLEFDLRVVAGNSGLQFRSQRVEGYGLHGYQADAGQVYWGSLYEEGRRGMLHRAPEEVWSPVVDVDGWNHYVVEARGDRLRIEVNGSVTTDLRDDAVAEGRLGFQLHAGTSSIRLRNLRVREL